MAKRKSLQIGAGMVGRCIVNDMIKDFDGRDSPFDTNRKREDSAQSFFR